MITYRILMETRNRLFPRCLYHSFREPFVVEKANDQYYNSDILDLYNNVCHVGHSNRAVLRAVFKSYSTININSRFLHQNLVKYAERLERYIPAGYKMLFVNSGSEANDLALRIALLANPGKKLASMAYSYHGTSYLCDKVSHLYSVGIPKDVTTQEDIVYIPRNDLENLSSHKDQLAGFIVETIQGVGGNFPLSSSFLQKAFQWCKENSIITIADEVQTGFWRTGYNFWSYEYSGIVPDIITCGKPIANGYPMGAVIMRADLADLLGSYYFNTFGGSSAATGVALAVLNELEQRCLGYASKTLGDYLVSKLVTISWIHNITGRGLFIGFKTNFENPCEIVEYLKENKIIVGLGANGTIRIKPPLVITKENIDNFIQTLERFLI